MCRPGRPTSINAGRWSTLKNGFPTDTCVSAWTVAAPGARPASSTSGRCAKRKTWPFASTGAGCNPGRTARSASTESRITARTNGRRRRSAPSTWQRSAPGKRPPTSTATWRITAEFCATASRTIGHGPRSTRCSTGGFKSRMTGDWVSGPVTLSEEELGANRRNFYEDCLAHKLDTDEYWQSRMPDWSKVRVPLLSTANWGGQGLHPRGNFEGFVRAASKNKWLEVHGLDHWTHFYTDYGLGLQKKFFGHFLKGEATGWDKQPKVLLQVRHPGEKFV